MILMTLMPLFCYLNEQTMRHHCEHEINKSSEYMQLSNVPSEFYFQLGKYCAYKDILIILDKESCCDTSLPMPINQ